MIFELPNASGSFTERVEQIRAVTAVVALQERLRHIVGQGGEGLMLHKGDAERSGAYEKRHAAVSKLPAGTSSFDGAGTPAPFVEGFVRFPSGQLMDQETCTTHGKMI